MPLPNISSLDDFGGPKANYAPITDPTTDEDAADRNRAFCDVAMMGHTAPRAFVRFVAVDGATPTEPANAHDAMWGSSVSVKPAVSRLGEGVWQITWPTTVNDELTPEDEALGGGETHTVNIRAAIAQATPVGGVLKHASAVVASANTVVVYGYLANGTADDIAGSIVTVVIW